MRHALYARDAGAHPKLRYRVTVIGAYRLDRRELFHGEFDKC